MSRAPAACAQPDARAASSTPTCWSRRSPRAGRRARQPTWRRVEMRYVDLKAGRHLQITSYDQTQAFTANHARRATRARDAVDALLDEPFGNWHVDTTTQSHQVQVTKKLEAVVHTTDRSEEVEVERGHDRDKARLLPEDDPVFIALGISDAEGRLKPSRQAKYRQVEEFLRLLDSSITDALDKGHLRTADGRGAAADRRPRLRQRLPDLRRPALPHRRPRAAGAAHRCRRQGAVPRAQLRRSPPSSVSTREFVVGTIGGVTLDPAPEVVLALHACDTATDEALAQAVGWGASLVLAAPCCHHDIAAQLRTYADARAVRHADPARHPPRAPRGHPHRRAAGVADAPAGLPRRRRAVRREPAHAAQHDAARGPDRRPGQGRLGAQGVRRAGDHLGLCGPRSPSCSSPDARPDRGARVGRCRSSSAR